MKKRYGMFRRGGVAEMHECPSCGGRHAIRIVRRRRKTMTIYLDPEQKIAVAALAVRLQRSVASLVRDGIELVGEIPDDDVLARARARRI